MSELPALIYFVSSLTAGVGMAFFLVWRQAKPVWVRSLYTAILLAFPALLGLMAYSDGRSWASRTFSQRARFGAVERCLKDETISDEKLAAAAWDAEDLREELEKLLPPPPSRPPQAVERHDEVQVTPPERAPSDRIRRGRLPVSLGPADLAGTTGADARLAMLLRKLTADWWDGKGVVVTGQLRVEGGPAGVAAREMIYPNGVFVHRLYPSEERELQFFKSGYEPLTIWLDPRKRHPKRLDLGVIEMKKCARPTALTLSVRLPEGVPSADLRLRTGTPAPTWNDWGYECGAPIHQTVAERPCRSGEKVRFDGLSGIPYELKISAPGCVVRTFYCRGVTDRDLGEIALEKTRRQTFRMRPFSGGEWKPVTLELNGDTTLVVAPKDELGNTVDIRLTPDRGSPRVLADFPWRPVYYDDYGETAPETAELPEPKHYEGTKFLTPGHLYRMRQESKKVDILLYLEK